jgi:hypothetical protein
MATPAIGPVYDTSPSEQDEGAFSYPMAGSSLEKKRLMQSCCLQPDNSIHASH